MGRSCFCCNEKIYGKTVLNEEIHISKYQKKINHMSKLVEMMFIILKCLNLWVRLLIFLSNFFISCIKRFSPKFELLNSGCSLSAGAADVLVLMVRKNIVVILYVHPFISPSWRDRLKYHRERFRKLTFRALAPRQNEALALPSDKRLTLEMSTFKIFHGWNSTFINSFERTKFLFYSPTDGVRPFL